MIFNMNLFTLLRFCSFLVLKLYLCDAVIPLNEENITRIYKIAMSGDYKKEVVPIENNKPVEVAINMFIVDMVPIEQVDMHFSMDAYLRMEWIDHRLAFDNDNPDVFVPFDDNFASKIWKPNIYFPIGKKALIHDMLLPNVLLNLYGNGTVRYSVRISMLTFCPMGLSFYPFDIQDCKVKMECYAYSRDYVRLRWMDTPIERSGVDLHIADYNKVQLKASSEIHYEGDYNQTFDTLLLKVKFDRDFTLYFLRDFFPCVMIVMLSWISFWINYKAVPARVALGITTVLTIVTMTNSIRATAPKSKSFRSLDYYMLLCMLFVFGALGEFALVGMSYSKSKRFWYGAKRSNGEEQRHQGGLKTTSLNIVKSKENLSIGSDGEPVSPKEQPNSKMLNQNKDMPDRNVKVRCIGPLVIFSQDQHIVDNISKIAFPLAFLAANGVYFLFHRFHPETVN